ncbi:MAG: hypothetical protein U9Q34_02860 [Elusimicrobiota bacterium]|nr:hypothetical protein [Elusimicrobiota bacterium]
MKKVLALVLCFTFAGAARAQTVNFDQGIDTKEAKITHKYGGNYQPLKISEPLPCKDNGKLFIFDKLQDLDFKMRLLEESTSIVKRILDSSNSIIDKYKENINGTKIYVDESKTGIILTIAIISVGNDFILYREFIGDFSKRTNTIFYDKNGKISQQTMNNKAYKKMTKSPTCSGCTGFSPPIDPGTRLGEMPSVDGVCFAKHYAACIVVCRPLAEKCFAGCAVAATIMCTHAEERCIVCPYDVPEPQP